MVATVLFDIDGTLCTLAGAGRKAFELACADVFGWPDACRDIRFAGATDLGVLQKLADRFGVELEAEATLQFFLRYADLLDQAIENADATVFPGVPDLLARLTTDAGFQLGLVTGNAQATAQIKLERVGLFHHFGFGGFGDEVSDRRIIASRAKDRAHRREPASIDRPVFLVGDTPSDIHAARAIGAISIVVATGTYTADALKKAGGDHVLDDLGDLGSVLSLLGGP